MPKIVKNILITHNDHFMAGDINFALKYNSCSLFEKDFLRLIKGKKKQNKIRSKKYRRARYKKIFYYGL